MATCTDRIGGHCPSQPHCQKKDNWNLTVCYGHLHCIMMSSESNKMAASTACRWGVHLTRTWSPDKLSQCCSILVRMQNNGIRQNKETKSVTCLQKTDCQKVFQNYPYKQWYNFCIHNETASYYLHHIITHIMYPYKCSYQLQMVTCHNKYYTDIAQLNCTAIKWCVSKSKRKTYKYLCNQCIIC